MIEIDHLSKRFGTFTAVDDVSFSVAKGEVLGFLGPNGAGKSTTMKMITGYLPPSSGTVRVCGYDVARDPVTVKSHIGYLPEGAPSWPDMTAEGFLSFAARIRGLDGKDLDAALERAVDGTNLHAVRNQPIATLSKGFKRRVGLAQALLHDPDVLILDEPTDGLDPNQKHDVRELIRRLAAEKAIVVSTHILEEVEAVCSRAIIIDQGCVVADATPEDLERKAEHHNAVHIQVNGGDTEKAKELLSSLGGVARVQDSGGDRLIVLPNGAGNIAPDVAEKLRQANIALNELYVERGRLDEVFRAMTKGDTASTSEPQEATHA